MRYSWAQFVIGVVAGTIGVGLLSMMPRYFPVAALLMFVATALIVQAPKRAASEERFTSDLDEWRKLGRQLVTGLPAAAAKVVLAVLLVLVVQLVVYRYASIPDVVRHTIAVVLLAAAWIHQVIHAFRSAKRRHSHGYSDV